MRDPGVIEALDAPERYARVPPSRDRLPARRCRAYAQPNPSQ